MSSNVRWVISLLCLLLFVSSAHPQQNGQYDAFHSYVFSSIHHWNKQISDKEIEDYCASTWSGCDGNLRHAQAYYHVSIKEQGVRNIDLISRGITYGYSGATLKVVKRATHHKPYSWIRKHPNEVNEALAHYFSHTLKAKPLWWYANTDPIKLSNYGHSIDIIRSYCDRVAPPEMADIKIRGRK